MPLLPRPTLCVSLSALLFVAGLWAPGAQADGQPNAVERAAKKAGGAVDATVNRAENWTGRTVERAENWAARTSKRTTKAVGRAADKTESWIKKKTQ